MTPLSSRGVTTAPRCPWLGHISRGKSGSWRAWTMRLAARVHCFEAIRVLPASKKAAPWSLSTCAWASISGTVFWGLRLTAEIVEATSSASRLLLLLLLLLLLASPHGLLVLMVNPLNPW